MTIESFISKLYAWNIQGMVILSMLLQCFLIFTGLLRKHKGGKWFVKFPIWFAYLLADWVAISAIGLILRAVNRSNILVLWAPFLLLHLGGPDTITSFSLEDNEFWIRHLFGLMLQVGSTFYVIGQSLRGHNEFLLPTFLVLTAGIIKYAERNRAFYHASFDHFAEEEWDYSEGTTYTYYLSWITKPFIGILKQVLVGPLVFANLRDPSRKWFLPKEARDMLQTIEIDLSLLFEVLHTKYPVVASWKGWLLRVMSLGCIFAALSIFFLTKKPDRELEKFDLGLTYALLIGAIVLDLISVGLFIFFSDMATFHPCGWRNRHDMKEKINKSKSFIVKRRWSRSIPQLNLITAYVDEQPTRWRLNKLAAASDCLRSIVDFARGYWYLSHRNLRVNQEWDFIVVELKGKAELAKTAQEGREICLKRGDGVLQKQQYDDDHLKLLKDDLIWSVRDFDYTQSLIIWHIATERCYQVQEQQNQAESNIKDYRSISKVLSDYMFYLLEMQPAIMTRKHYVKLIRNTTRYDIQRELEKVGTGGTRYGLPAELFRSTTDTSILPEAQKLVGNLQKHEYPWKIMSQVWVEMMCYAAIDCRPSIHGLQPSQGGQLLTIVWLLMNYLGMGTCFAADQVRPAYGVMPF